MCVLKVKTKGFYLGDCEKGKWDTLKKGNKIIGFLSGLKLSNVSTRIRLEQCIIYYNKGEKIVMYEIKK